MRVLRWLGLALLLAMAVLVCVLGFETQRADYLWNPGRVESAFTSRPPRVLFDEAHHNASTAGFSGRYWPFARLLRAAGCTLVRSREPFSGRLLKGGDVLVVVNAAGAARPQVFGINLTPNDSGRRGDPAFTSSEIEAVRAWVEGGGSLLLIADHAPFGASASALAAAFGVRMHGGFVEVPGERSDPLSFTRANGRLGEHLILDGDGHSPAVDHLMTFTGQSLDAPPGATVLLRLPPTAVEAVPEGGQLAERPAGAAQGIAQERGRGRVVVLGEAAMATAQVHRRDHFGMNTRGNDNRRFVLNVIRWLARQL